MIDDADALWDRIDLAHLEVLRELADRGSVTAVADATHKTPSAVSQQLKVLQRQLGVVLVERVGRGVRRGFRCRRPPRAAPSTPIAFRPVC